MMAATAALAFPKTEVTAPPRAGLVLATLITVAAVANLPLLMANVALPSIGVAFDASQTALNLVAVSYSLGLACSVLWLGALGDRYGRKRMLVLGMILAMPAALISGFAPTIQILIAARVVGGFAAGMAFPTTLALITALWSGAPRTHAIALWAASGGAIQSLGQLLAGMLLARFAWGSVFLVIVPVAAVALVMALKLVPAHVNETTDPVDNLGGVLSMIFVGSLIMAINFAPVPNQGTLVLILSGVTIVVGALFFIRQRRAKFPLYDLHVAKRRIFWVAACAGIVVFGALMGAMFIAQQFLQNVMGYSTMEAGLAVVPAAVFMLLVAPRSAKLIEAYGSRFTLLAGFLFVGLGFITMLFWWKEGASIWPIAFGFSCIGAGVGLAGTPSSHSLTGSVPVKRAGMASATADLQRDLGGAIMQSILGALLVAGYATAFGAKIAASPEAAQVTNNVSSQLELSYARAEAIAQQYPNYASQITVAARASFLAGDQWACMAGIIAVALGALLVWFFFPKKTDELRLLAAYQAEDAPGTDGKAGRQG
ncbi:MAG: MFS transporter [Anaerolineales bacterium]|nr:MFS transporter [Anaerolineales bacterium]